MAQKFAVDAIFRAVDQISSPIRRASKNVSKATARMERSIGKVNGALSGVRRGFTAVGAAAVAGGAVVGAALLDATKVGAEFEKTLVGAGAKFADPIDRGTKAYDELADAALRVSSSTEFSASEAAGALAFMAKAGEDATVSMQSLRTFADLASVAETDLATAADLASDAIGPLGLATDDLSKKAGAYAKTADLMSRTSNMANLSVAELFESITAGAGSFRAAGQDADQFLAAAGVLAGVGIKGSKAGKDLARGISRMTDAGTKAPKALKKLKIAVADGEGNIRDFLDIMTDLREAFKGIDEAAQAQAVSDIFGANSKAAGVAILDNIEKARQFQETLSKADGFTEKTALKARDTVAGAIKSLESNIEALKIEAFLVMREDIDEIVKSTTEWVKANKEVFSERFRKALTFVRDNFMTILKVGAGFIALIATLFAVSQALAAVQAVMAIVSAVTAVAAGSVGLIVVAILATIAAVGVLLFFWDDLIQGIKDGNPWIIAAAAVFAPLIAIIAIAKGIVNGLIAAWQFFAPIYEDMIAGVREGNPAWMALATALLPIVIIVEVLKLAAKGFMVAWEVLPKFFVSLWEAVAQIFTTAVSAIADKITAVKDLFNSFSDSKQAEIEIKTKVTPPELPDSVTTPVDIGAPEIPTQALAPFGGELPAAAEPPPQPKFPSFEDLDPLNIKLDEFGQIQLPAPQVVTPEAPAPQVVNLPDMPAANEAPPIPQLELPDLGALQLPENVINLADVQRLQLPQLGTADRDEPAPEPQVVDTRNETIARTVSETVRAMRLDINVNDKSGAVESIEQSGDFDDNVSVVNSGAL